MSDFPWYCSFGPLGYAACPDKSKPWYCYMGGVIGRTQCANNGYIEQDPITNAANGVADAASSAAHAAGSIAANLDLILKITAFGGVALVVLYAAKTIHDIAR